MKRFHVGVVSVSWQVRTLAWMAACAAMTEWKDALVSSRHLLPDP